MNKEQVLKAYEEEVKYSEKTRARIIETRAKEEAELRQDGGYIPLIQELWELDRQAEKEQRERLQRLRGMNDLMRQLGLEDETYEIMKNGGRK